MLMWTLASTLLLWPLPDFDHLAAQQGRQRAARWLIGKAHLGQVRQGLPEPEAFAQGVGVQGVRQSQPREVRGLCLWRNEQENKSQNKVVPVWLQEQHSDLKWGVAWLPHERTPQPFQRLRSAVCQGSGSGEQGRRYKCPEWASPC